MKYLLILGEPGLPPIKLIPGGMEDLTVGLPNEIYFSNLQDVNPL